MKMRSPGSAGGLARVPTPAPRPDGMSCRPDVMSTNIPGCFVSRRSVLHFLKCKRMRRRTRPSPSRVKMRNPGKTSGLARVRPPAPRLVLRRAEAWRRSKSETDTTCRSFLLIGLSGIRTWVSFAGCNVNTSCASSILMYTH